MRTSNPKRKSPKLCYCVVNVITSERSPSALCRCTNQTPREPLPLKFFESVLHWDRRCWQIVVIERLCLPALHVKAPISSVVSQERRLVYERAVTIECDHHIPYQIPVSISIDPNGSARDHRERLHSGTNTFGRPPRAHRECNRKTVGPPAQLQIVIPVARCARRRIRCRSSCRHEPSPSEQS